jgi:excisionase family DNA binding protein
MAVKKGSKRAAARCASAEGETLVLSVPKAGALIGLSRNSAYQAVKRGQLPTIRIGKRLLVPKAALQRLLDSAGRTAAA